MVSDAVVIFSILFFSSATSFRTGSKSTLIVLFSTFRVDWLLDTPVSVKSSIFLTDNLSNMSLLKIILSGLAGLSTKPLPENVIFLNTLPIL